MMRRRDWSIIRKFKEQTMDKKTSLALMVPRFFNKPLLISPAYMTTLSHALEGDMPDVVDKMLASMERPVVKEQNSTAIIGVYDYLSYRADFLMSIFFGNTSYEDIRTQFQAALADPAIKNIVFDINSPGGEVAGCFDLVDEIYQARGQKPIYAVFNEDGYSAAYAIASAVDKRYISRTGSAGSVGVVAMHIDQSGMDAQRGIVFTPIYAGARKVDFSSHAPLSADALAVAQDDVNAVYDIFVATVARNLGQTPEAVRATEAAIYQGKKAVQSGFADSVMSWNQFMNKLNNRKYGGIMKAELEKMWNEMTAKFKAMIGDNPDAAKDAVTKADAEKLVAAAEESARKEGHTAGLSEGTAAGKTEADARVTQIMEICVLGKVDTAGAIAYLQDKALGVEDIRAKVVEAQANEAEKTRIRSTTGALSTGEVNPLIADAKKRAEAANIRLVK
jgi:capsid assembly protease